ncbi:Plasmid recombination enzyme [Cohaesibacter sp. ES.047]|uniref:plasmid recombination protein n=1 Tax=Cohaesibacter sp. ES.047 TaxID=1798205 RepID=UPI000BB9B050|nr:plasmid recombination protein [Cohaesibacter sp. ES.047]SNY93489.1 Plasmid recombination enzyme [Cohaesibacter sp. ES.047]
MNYEKNYIVIDIKRISDGKLKSQTDHCRRSRGRIDHCDLKRTKLNKTVIGIEKDPYQSAKNYIESQKAHIHKRNETPYTSLILTASPEFFDLNPENSTRWENITTKWVLETFGSNAVYLEFHEDEKTKHAHLTVVPTYQKFRKGKPGKVYVSHHEHPVFAGRDSYHRLLDSYEAVCKPLGLRRSRSTDTRSPTTKSQHATEMLNAAETELQISRRLQKHSVEFLEYSRNRIVNAVEESVDAFFIKEGGDQSEFDAFERGTIEICPPHGISKKDLSIIESRGSVSSLISKIISKLRDTKYKLEKEYNKKMKYIYEREKTLNEKEFLITEREKTISIAVLMSARERQRRENSR